MEFSRNIKPGKEDQIIKTGLVRVGNLESGEGLYKIEHVALEKEPSPEGDNSNFFKDLERSLRIQDGPSSNPTRYTQVRP